MDSMSLTLPAKSDYVLALRLFISGVAARTDMHVEDIEDVKSAINEACVLLLSGVESGKLKVDVYIHEHGMDVEITAEDCEYGSERLDEITFDYFICSNGACVMMIAGMTVNSGIARDAKGLFKSVSMSFAALT